MHTTNYSNTFIAVAPDCPATEGTPPASKAPKPTLAEQQFALLSEAPYRYTSDELLFSIHAERQGIPATEREEARTLFFSKGQPCLRTSPLAKRYGYGFHFNAQGLVALLPLGSAAYAEKLNDTSLRQVQAMRSARP